VRGGGGNFLKPLVSWTDEFSVGVDTIDSEHKRMLVLINEIDEVIQQGGAYEQFAEIDEVIQQGGAYEQFAPALTDLIDHTNSHFAHEEKLLEENHCPDLEAHKKSHVRLREELTRWQEKVAEARAEDMNEHMLFLRIWFPGHILNVDKKDADYFT